MDPKRHDVLAAQRAKNEALSLGNLTAQRNEEIGRHLKILQDEQVEDSQMLLTVLQAVIQADGISRPVEAIAADCEALAARLSSVKRKREWAEVKALLDGLNARNPNPGMVLAAKRVGVELSDSTPAPLVGG